MNHLYFGDNLRVLRESIRDESVDLDPPFNSNASYNLLFRSPYGKESGAQIEAFDDTWHWGEARAGTTARRSSFGARKNHQFQLWAVSLIPDAQPWRDGKKGADRGIDGVLYVEPEKGKTERCIISVKGGLNVNSGMVRDLKGTMEREKAPMGLFVTLTPPTKEMTKEAAAAGVLSSPNWRDVPRIQIVMIEDLLTQIVPPVRIPMARRDTFKKAAREKTEIQPSLDL